METLYNVPTYFSTHDGLIPWLGPGRDHNGTETGPRWDGDGLVSIYFLVYRLTNSHTNPLDQLGEWILPHH